MDALTDLDLERYARHIVLREIGGDGQLRLKNATVAIMGAGGIGSPAIQYLAGAGVGTIRIVDDDTVDTSNLQRQTIYNGADLRTTKADAAAAFAMRLNPGVAASACRARIDAENVAALIEGADVVIDGTDNFATRLLVAKAAHAARIPLVSAAVGQFEGQLAVYRGWEAGKPCYRCLVSDDPDRVDRNCSEQGVLGPVTGVLGTLAALEAIRAIVPFGEDVAGRLLLVDLLSWRFRAIAVPPDPACPVCSDHALR
ncbi:HesA/MoeB/ThiF family protein [Sphingomonas metalli]|nr:HesA/MoeB/ThiF family protein [Sphingomonas metalli]